MKQIWDSSVFEMAVPNAKVVAKSNPSEKYAVLILLI